MRLMLYVSRCMAMCTSYRVPRFYKYRITTDHVEEPAPKKPNLCPKTYLSARCSPPPKTGVDHEAY